MRANLEFIIIKIYKKEISNVSITKLFYNNIRDLSFLSIIPLNSPNKLLPPPTPTPPKKQLAITQ